MKSQNPGRRKSPKLPEAQVVVFRQFGENRSRKDAVILRELDSELRKGRLRQGWFLSSPSLSLELDDRTVLKNVKGQFKVPHRSGRKLAPKHWLGKISAMRKILPGALIVIPHKPDKNDITFAISRKASGVGKYPCYRVARPLSSSKDFRHCIAVDPKTVRVVKGAQPDMIDLSKLEHPVSFAHKHHGALMRLYFTCKGAWTEWAASGTAAESEGFFGKKNAGNVTVNIQGGTFDKSRKHEVVVCRLIDLLQACQAQLHPKPHPIDVLLLNRPGRAHPVAFEVKRVGKNPFHAAREAVGQLIHYGWRSELSLSQCVVLDVVPTDDVVRFVEEGAKMALCWLTSGKLRGGRLAKKLLGPLIN